MYNEPHDVGNYNQGSKKYQWNDYIDWIEDMAEALLDEGVNWLFGVQGTNSDCDSIRYTSKYWYAFVFRIIFISHEHLIIV